MNVLGLDAALIRTGWAVIEIPVWTPGALPVIDFMLENNQNPLKDTGFFRNKSISRDRQLEFIYQETNKILDKHKIDYAFLEQPGKWARGYANSNQKTIEALAQARAAMLLALRQHGVVSEEVGTNDVKALVAWTPGWRGGIPKERVRAVLEQIKLYSGDDEDIADAVSIAYAGSKLLYTRGQEQHHKLAQRKRK